VSLFASVFFERMLLSKYTPFRIFEYVLLLFLLYPSLEKIQKLEKVHLSLLYREAQFWRSCFAKDKKGLDLDFSATSLQ
jgi:hypothetical protein